MINLRDLTIEKAHQAIKSGEFTAVELAQAYLDNIKEKNTELNLYLEVYDDVLEQAKVADDRFKDGTASLLTGIPIAIKDNILCMDKIASAASKILENHVAVYDSTVVKILKKEGAVILGRTNMDEFAMGSSNQTSAYGPAKNPLDPTRVPGGSSGGSAGVVAGDLALVALGTETSGSVREPAAFCGLVGVKPTYGALSRHGVIAMGNSLDQVAPFAKTARDAEIVFECLSKYDPEDATSIKEEEERSLKTKDYKLKAKRIGVPWHLFESGVETEIIENFKESLQKLEAEGCEVVDIELPYCKYSLAAYYVIMPAEVSTNLARFDGIRYGFHQDGADLIEIYKGSRAEGFGAEARRRILLGTYVLSHGYYDAYYNKAIKIREKIRQEITGALKEVDLIATPTAPVLPFKLGEKLDDPVAMYLCDIFSAPANLSGVPAIAIPTGTNKESLPYSIQFMAPPWGEKSLFEIAKKFEIIK